MEWIKDLNGEMIPLEEFEAKYEGVLNEEQNQ